MCTLRNRVYFLAICIFILGSLVACGDSESESESATCDDGMWNDDGDPATECVAWSDCETGQYEVAPGSATVDRQCASCEEGFYAEGVNSSVCQPYEECAAGTGKSSDGTERVVPICEVCEPGTYCAGGESEPVACGEGMWDHDGDPATECVAWSDCEAGQYEVASGSAIEDRQCGGCANGEYSSGLNATSCQAWTECVAGQFVSQEPQADSDRQCESCAEGLFSDTVNAAECTQWKVCGDNEYVIMEGTETMDRQCESCPEEEFSLGPNAQSCQNPDWKSVSGGESHTCAVRSADESIWCWGSGYAGQLGLGIESGRDTPHQVAADDPDLATGWKSVSAGNDHTCALRVDDESLWCWGRNTEGQLGLGEDLSDQWTPEQVLADDADLALGWQSVSAGGQHTCAMHADESIWCWGRNTEGQLGLNDTTNRLVPEQVLADDSDFVQGWKSVSSGGWHTCALRSDDGSLWCWGYNSYGVLGLGDNINREAPEQVLADDAVLALGWERIFGGRVHTCALRASDESLWCWGKNHRGQLGLGDLAHRLTPEQVLADDADLAQGWKSVSGGYKHTCALRSDDESIWCWGRNHRGQLGLGDLSDRLLPEQVLAGDSDLGLNWRNISLGYYHSCAVRAVDESLWCWGGGFNGQLGLGDDYADHVMPQQIFAE